MPRLPAIIALLAAVSLVACGEETNTLPRVCLASGPERVEAALEAAPGQVRLGGVPLSACLGRLSDTADVQAVGSTWLAVASRLADRARSDPDGPAARRLAYLVGAARRGAARTQGIHGELLRRLEQELAAVDRDAPPVRAAERAGATGG